MGLLGLGNGNSYGDILFPIFQFPVCPLLLPLVTAGAISTNGAAGSTPFISLPSRSFEGFPPLPPCLIYGVALLPSLSLFCSTSIGGGVIIFTAGVAANDLQ